MSTKKPKDDFDRSSRPPLDAPHVPEYRDEKDAAVRKGRSFGKAFALLVLPPLALAVVLAFGQVGTDKENTVKQPNTLERIFPVLKH